MHEMQTIFTNVCGVCLLVCLSVTNAPSDPGSASLSRDHRQRVQGSFDATFAK